MRRRRRARRDDPGRRLAAGLGAPPDRVRRRGRVPPWPGSTSTGCCSMPAASPTRVPPEFDGVFWAPEATFPLGACRAGRAAAPTRATDARSRSGHRSSTRWTTSTTRSTPTGSTRRVIARGWRGRGPGHPADGPPRVRPRGRSRRDGRRRRLARRDGGWSCRVSDPQGRTCCAPDWRRPARTDSDALARGRRHRRRGHRRRGRVGRPGGPGLRWAGHDHRARSDLSARVIGPVGGVDPPAVLDAREHPDVAVLVRLAAGHRRCLVARGRLPVPGHARRAPRCSRRTSPSRQPRERTSCCSRRASWRRASRGWRSMASRWHRSGCRGEGWFDGYALVQALARPKARDAGRRARDRGRRGMGLSGGRVVAVAPRRRSLASGATPSSMRPGRGPRGRRHGRRRPSGGGPRDARCSCSTPGPRLSRGCPLVIDTSGVWFRPEGDGFICGIAPSVDEDLPGLPLEVDRAPVRGAILAGAGGPRPGVRRDQAEPNAWAGYYEVNTFDHNAIIGAPSRDRATCSSRTASAATASSRPRPWAGRSPS